MMRSLRDWAVGTTELLDDPRADAGAVVASLHDIERINRAFGGTRAALAACDEFLGAGDLTLLDVGTGLGDIPRAIAARAARRGVRVRVIGLERHPAAARAARAAGGLAALVAASRSVDVALCAKLLHHLPGATGCALLRELDRVARRGVIVADLRRSAVAAAGIWLASFPMRFHPATRRDGVISVLRGFTDDELRRRCAEAGVDATVRRHPGWELTASWRPA
jgi:2-polyprenyl-3-methyl-5-hydroxy-6-metoxy-1,4-benzoquinol methylase